MVSGVGLRNAVKGGTDRRQRAALGDMMPIYQYRFLPRDSYAKRGICRRRVSVCVCVCVRHTPVLYQNG